jgi:hypothetical protein
MISSSNNVSNRRPTLSIAMVKVSSEVGSRSSSSSDSVSSSAVSVGAVGAVSVAGAAAGRSASGSTGRSVYRSHPVVWRSYSLASCVCRDGRPDIVPLESGCRLKGLRCQRPPLKSWTSSGSPNENAPAVNDESWMKNRRSLFGPRTLRCSTISCCLSAVFSPAGPAPLLSRQSDKEMGPDNDEVAGRTA